MFYLFRLGPLDVLPRKAWAFAAADDDAYLLPPELHHNPSKALQAFVEKHSDKTLRCEPALAELAARHGIEPAPLPQPVLSARAALAFALGGPLRPTRGDREVLKAFLESCALFWERRPWERCVSDVVVPVSVRTGGRRHQREASVLGAGGEEFGLALFDTPGSLARMVDAVDAGRMAEAGRIASVAVTFEDEPAWAVQAMEDAYGLPVFPIPVRVTKRGVDSPAPAELAELAAVMDAVSMLLKEDAPEDADSAEVEFTLPGFEVTAVARLPAEGLLEEPEDEDAAEPLRLAEPPSSEPPDRTPRNAPCPCGSGRKYKRCHLAEDEERKRIARGQGPGAEEARANERRIAERDPVHNLDGRILGEALTLARRLWGREFDPEAVLAKLGLDGPARRALDGWSAAHYRGAGPTALDVYVAEHARALDDGARRLISARTAAFFSIHEVLSVTPGVSLSLRDTLTGAEQTVEEKSASRTLVVRDVLLAEVLDLGEKRILGGCHPIPLPPREGDTARRELRRALGVRGAKVSLAKLRAATDAALPIAIWQTVVDELAQRPPPRLHNTDGEVFLLTTDTFVFPAGTQKEVLAALRGLPGAQADEGDEDAPPEETSVSFVKEGNALGALPSTLVGRALVSATRLRVETNSRERADRLRSLVQERLGGVVKFRAREHSDPLSAPNRTAQRPRPPEPVSPEVQEVLQRMRAEYDARWLDMQIPALGGLTPREAARRGGAATRKLELLLAEFENHQARSPPEQRSDIQKLRAALGLQAGASPSPG